MSDAAFIVAYCSSCNVNIYRSVRPLVIGQDALDPKLFRPAAPEIPPAEDGKAACPVCGTLLRFVPEAPPVPRTETPRPTAPVAVTPPIVQELFRLEDDEAMIEATDVGDGFLLVTTRRILKVSR